MTKTEFVLIGSRQKLNSPSALPALEINGTQLSRVNFTKSLGVLIVENLTGNNHINAITKKNFSGIGSIKRVSLSVPPATLHTIYHGFVQSHFDYCSVLWGNCAKRELKHARFLRRERQPEVNISHPRIAVSTLGSLIVKRYLAI